MLRPEVASRIASYSQRQVDLLDLAENDLRTLPSWMCWKRWTTLIYLPLYPDDPRADFKFRFFESSPNALGRILAGAEKFEAFVKVIDVPLASGNRLAHVMADARKGCALCWLDEARGEPALEGEREGSLMDSDPWTR